MDQLHVTLRKLCRKTFPSPCFIGDITKPKSTLPTLSFLNFARCHLRQSIQPEIPHADKFCHICEPTNRDLLSRDRDRLTYWGRYRMSASALCTPRGTDRTLHRHCARCTLHVATRGARRVTTACMLESVQFPDISPRPAERPSRAVAEGPVRRRRRHH